MTSASASPHSRPWRPRLAVIGWLMLLLTVVCAAVAPAALAHNALVSSNPVADSVVATAPTSIELVFNQDVKDFQPKIAITISGHDPVEIVPTVNGPTVTADLTSVDLPGRDSPGPVSWRVGYRIVSADGHPVAGLLDFSVGSAPAPILATETAPTAGGSTQAEPIPVADSDNGNASESPDQTTGTRWWWIGGALVIAAAISGVVIASRRAQQTRRPS